MVKIKEVEVTNPELDALEDLIVAWNLCKKHTAESDSKSEVELFEIQNKCKDCQREVKRIRNKTLHLWSKLVHEYNIARYGKCEHL